MEHRQGIANAGVVLTASDRINRKVSNWYSAMRAGLLWQAVREGVQ